MFSFDLLQIEEDFVISLRKEYGGVHNQVSNISKKYSWKLRTLQKCIHIFAWADDVSS